MLSVQHRELENVEKNREKVEKQQFYSFWSYFSKKKVKNTKVEE